MKRPILLKIFFYYILINIIIYLFVFPLERFSLPKYAYNDYGASFLLKSNNVLFFYLFYIFITSTVFTILLWFIRYKSRGSDE